MIKNLGRVTGKSAYELWLDEGNEGSIEDFFSFLQPVITVDDEITDNGRNPVAGGAVKSYIDTLTEAEKAEVLQFVQAEIANMQITVDNSVDESSLNPVQNQAIKAYVDTAIANATAAFINGDEVSY